MTSFRQIEANRRSALQSTGPISEPGNAGRGETRSGKSNAQTVVETIEDIEDYRGFEAAGIASYDAGNAVERELMLRLASLLLAAASHQCDRDGPSQDTGQDFARSENAPGDQSVARHAVTQFVTKRCSEKYVDQDKTDGCKVYRDMWGRAGYAVARGKSITRFGVLLSSADQIRQWRVRAAQPIRICAIAPGIPYRTLLWLKSARTR